MKKKIFKLFLILILIINISFTIFTSKVNALSNGYNFLDEGKNPLSVIVTIYSDAYSRGFAWTTMEETASSVVEISKEKESTDWSKALSYSGTVKESEAYYTHKVVVENLEVGEYVYRVGSKEDNAYSDIGSITISEYKDSIELIYTADPQDYDEVGFGAWANLVKSSFETLEGADAFICAGDIVNDAYNLLSHDLDQFIYALSMPKEYFMNSIFIPASGNHEAYGTYFTDRFTIDYKGSKNTGGYYSFDIGNIHLSVLNTNESNDFTEQVKWLEKDLAANQDDEWRIVLIHKGMMSTGDHSNDSDTLEVRKYFIPLMAKYKVDLVLQGHDHVYVRTVPYYYGTKEDGNFYSGKVPNNNETIVTEIENDKSISYSVEPDGTFYLTANYAGRKSYSPVNYDRSLIFPATNPYNDELMSKQITKQTFITLEIKGSSLKVNTYLFDGQSSKLYDSYNVKKNTHKEVEEEIDELKDVKDSSIFDYMDIKSTYLKYDSLVDNAKTKIQEENVNKLNKLIERYPLDKSEKSYNLALEINSVKEVNLSLELREKIKEIKSTYSDLSLEEKALVENYSRMDDIEKEIDNLYIIKAFNELYTSYKNGNRTSKEVTRAYSSLRDDLKERVDIEGFTLNNEVIFEEKGCNGVSSYFILISFITVFCVVLLCSKTYKKNNKKENISL